MLDREHAPLDRPPGRVVARPCCRGAYLRGAFLGAGSLVGPAVASSRDARADARRGRFVRSVASTAGARLRVVDRSGHAARLREGARADRGVPRRRRRDRDGARPRGAGVVAELRAEANRLANADHANLVRRAGPHSGSSRPRSTASRPRGAANAPGRLPRGGRAAPPPPRALAARARRAREPAGDEGRRCSAVSRVVDRSRVTRSSTGTAPSAEDRRPYSLAGGLALPGGGTRPRPPSGPGARTWGRGSSSELLPQPTFRKRDPARGSRIAVSLASGIPDGDSDAENP